MWRMVEILRTLYQRTKKWSMIWKRSRSFVGRNREEIAKFNQGPGGKKSFKADLIQAVLGDYCGVLNKNVLLERYKQRMDTIFHYGQIVRNVDGLYLVLNESDKLDIAEFQKFTGGKFDVRTHHQTEMQLLQHHLLNLAQTLLLIWATTASKDQWRGE